MKKLSILIAILIVAISALSIKANNNELKNIFIKLIPQNWIKIPDHILKKELNRVSKIVNTKVSNETYYYSLTTITDDYFNNPSVSLIFTNEESPTNKELLNSYNEYGDKIINSVIAKTPKVTDIKVTLKNKQIIYNSERNILTINFLLQYSNNYGSVEQVFMNSIFFTKDTIISVQGSFSYDNNFEKYKTEFKKYLNSISIPEKNKIYNSGFDKTIDYLKESASIIFFLFGIFILILLSTILESRFPNFFPFRLIRKIFEFVFRMTFKGLIRGYGSHHSYHHSQSDSHLNSDTDSQHNTEFQSHATKNEHHNITDNHSMNENHIEVDYSDDVIADNSIDDLLSDNMQLDDLLSNNHELDDILSEKTNIEDLINEKTIK